MEFLDKEGLQRFWNNIKKSISKKPSHLGDIYFEYPGSSSSIQYDIPTEFQESAMLMYCVNYNDLTTQEHILTPPEEGHNGYKIRDQVGLDITRYKERINIDRSSSSDIWYIHLVSL